MSVTAVGGTTTASQDTTSTSTAISNASVDYNSFLKLLVAEMSNQDPLNPTDSTEYMGQLATFSNVGQTIQTNKKLELADVGVGADDRGRADRPHGGVGRWPERRPDRRRAGHRRRRRRDADGRHDDDPRRRHDGILR